MVGAVHIYLHLKYNYMKFGNSLRQIHPAHKILASFVGMHSALLQIKYMNFVKNYEFGVIIV